jgi:hypothetical protein
MNNSPDAGPDPCYGWLILDVPYHLSDSGLRKLEVPGSESFPHEHVVE